MITRIPCNKCAACRPALRGSRWCRVCWSVWWLSLNLKAALART